MNKRFLIINADDAGLHPEINAGILDAVKAGVVTSVSLLVNKPHICDVKTLFDAGISLGLHFNLTRGFPCARPLPVTLIDEKGTFSPEGHERASSFNEDDIRREMKAQFERFQEIFGIIPDHLDAHKHLHRKNEVIFDIMIETAIEFEIPLRSLTDTMRKRCRASGVSTTDHFIGDVNPSPYWTVERLKDQLAALPPGLTEMMCHPGRKTESIEDLWYVSERSVELCTLLSNAAREAFSAVELTSFRDIPRVMNGLP